MLGKKERSYKIRHEAVSSMNGVVDNYIWLLWLTLTAWYGKIKLKCAWDVQCLPDDVIPSLTNYINQLFFKNITLSEHDSYRECAFSNIGSLVFGPKNVCPAYFRHAILSPRITFAPSTFATAYILKVYFGPVNFCHIYFRHHRYK